MSKSAEAGNNTHPPPSKMKDDYDQQIMSSLSAALSTLDTGHRVIGQNHPEENSGQANLNYFSSGKKKCRSRI